MKKSKILKLKKKGWKVGSTSEFLKDTSKPSLYQPLIPGDDAADKIVNECFAKKPLKTKKLLVNPSPSAYFDNIHKLNGILLHNIKKNLPKLEALLVEINKDYNYGDLFYRFYHGSFKVYWIQNLTEKIVKILKEMAPENMTKFDSYFEEILKEGTGKRFKSNHNKAWTKHTRPMLEAFCHAKYFLEQAIIFGKELKGVPTCLPSGWAGLLCFYNLR